MFLQRILLLVIALSSFLSASAQQIELSDSRKNVRTSGDIMAAVTPVACIATVLVLQDWEGMKQGAFAAATTVGMSYALKYIVGKERPDKSDKHSFPFPAYFRIFYRSRVYPETLRLEMGDSGLRGRFLCRLEPGVQQET